MRAGNEDKRRAPTTADDRSRDAARLAWTLVAALCAAGITASIAVLYLGGRYVMGQGGFVARGGPYVIASPAPGWIWIVPVSILLGAVCVGLHTLAGLRARGFGLLGFTWVALFGSLGWAFLDFGLNWLQDGIVWAWVVCGVVFWLMALPVVVVWLGAILPGVRARVDARMPVPPQRTQRPQVSATYLVAHIIALSAGVVLGVWVFQNVSGGA